MRLRLALAFLALVVACASPIRTVRLQVRHIERGMRDWLWAPCGGLAAAECDHAYARLGDQLRAERELWAAHAAGIEESAEASHRYVAARDDAARMIQSAVHAITHRAGDFLSYDSEIVANLSADERKWLADAIYDRSLLQEHEAGCNTDVARDARLAEKLDPANRNIARAAYAYEQCHPYEY
jgi:hypothetical protein